MFWEKLVEENNSKIIFIVLDGVGGLPVKGKTALELANTPNLDELAKKSACGLHVPVNYGITPGSGPGHTALFGYDPVENELGRGILEAAGLDMEVLDTDIAIRGNFATVKYEDNKVIVLDRRAGRIPTSENKRIVEKITQNIKEIDGVKVIMKSGIEHRSAIILRFKDRLQKESDLINDTDPQEVGLSPLLAKGKNPQSQKVADIVNKFSKMVADLLKDEKKANYLLLRGFAQKPHMPTMKERFKLNPVCIAVYPMYKGLSRLVGMNVLHIEGLEIHHQFQMLKEVYNDYNYFFIHIKKTDSYGEDGNIEKKVTIIEEFDKNLPDFLSLSADVLAITGDHSTPAKLKAHSWHPVPFLLHSKYVLGNTSQRFTERECLKGELSVFKAIDIMPLLLANALRLKKFGA